VISSLIADWRQVYPAGSSLYKVQKFNFFKGILVGMRTT
jgi:hypothetical protein